MKKLITTVIVLAVSIFFNVYKIEAFSLDSSPNVQAIQNLDDYTLVCTDTEKTVSEDNKDLTVTKEYNLVPNSLIDTYATNAEMVDKADLIGSSINVKITLNYYRTTLKNILHIKLKQYKCEIKMLDNAFAYKNGKHEIYNKGLNVPDADVVRKSYTTTTSSKSFTYVAPSSWKYVDTQQSPIVGGKVTVYITRSSNTYSGSFSLYV